MEPGEPSVRVAPRHPAPRKHPLYAAALAAFRSGQLNIPPRTRTIREASDYEQDLEGAEDIFPDEAPSPRSSRLLRQSFSVSGTPVATEDVHGVTPV